MYLVCMYCVYVYVYAYVYFCTDVSVAFDNLK